MARKKKPTSTDRPTKAKPARPNGSRSREKGAEFEREVATILREFYPEAKRGLAQSRNGAEVSDVTNVPWWVECKWHKTARPIREAVAQAIEASGGKLPILVVSKAGAERDPIVAVPMSQWLREHREVVALRAENQALMEEFIAWRKEVEAEATARTKRDGPQNS